MTPSGAVARTGPVPHPRARLAPELVELAQARAQQLRPDQWRVRGLYSGGTLCKEAAHILPGHELIDLGDDEFTVGRPHPMIDPRLRNERIVQAVEPYTFDRIYGFQPELVVMRDAKAAVARSAERYIHAIGTPPASA